MALVILMIPLALATEITGNLRTDPNFYQEETPVEPQPPQDNPSSSGGGSGGGGTKTTNQTTPLIEEVSAPVKETVAKEEVPSLKEDETIPTRKIGTYSLEKGEAASFTINGESHSLRMDQINENSVQFTLSSEPVTDTLKSSQIKSYDLKGNGVKDISIFLADIANGKAQLELDSLVATDELSEDSENSLTGAAVGVSYRNGWIYGGIGILAIIIVLVGGIVYFKLKRKR